MSADDKIPASDISDALVRLRLQVGERPSEPAEQPQASTNKSKDGNPKSENLPIKTDLRLVEPAVFDPEDLTKAAGTVGALIDWISAASLYPNRPLALGAALVTVGTLIGQRVAGLTHGSTHLYVVGIGGSASGKQQGIDSAKEALNEIGAQDRIGAGDFRSSVALVNSLKKQSVFCSFIDEYGLVLQRIGNKGAGGYEYDVVSVLQQLWGLNWTYFNSPAAARENSQRIFAPAFSLLGLSVPEHFYGAVTLKQIAGGLLNRHLIIRGEDRPPLQNRADGSWKVPGELKRRLQALYQQWPKLTLEEILNKRPTICRSNR